jgi:hypothetical protein
MADEEEQPQEEVSTPTSHSVVAFVHSESLKAIAPALLAAQIALKNPEKNAVNPHFKNRYADLGASVDAAKAALNKQGIVVTQVFAPAPYGSVGVTTLCIHKSGEYYGGTCLVPLDRDNAQGYGSAATYARRYGVQAILGMVAEDDDDGNAASVESDTARPSKKSSPAVPRKSIFGRR